MDERCPYYRRTGDVRGIHSASVEKRAGGQSTGQGLGGWAEHGWKEGGLLLWGLLLAAWWYPNT